MTRGTLLADLAWPASLLRWKVVNIELWPAVDRFQETGLIGVAIIGQPAERGQPAARMAEMALTFQADDPTLEMVLLSAAVTR